MSVDLKGKTVFLSGPMSGIEHMNVEAFAAAHYRVRELGAAEVYDPAVEYLTIRGEASLRTHEWWMMKCIGELSQPKQDGRGGWDWYDPDGYKTYYDVLVSLDGWEESDGAVMERRVAEACGIKVVDISELYE